MKRSHGDPFIISFVRGTGKRKGSIRVAQCHYGVKKEKPSSGISRKKGTIHKRSGRIPLQEVETEKPLTPFISHIIFYNNQKVHH